MSDDVLRACAANARLLEQLRLKVERLQSTLDAHIKPATFGPFVAEPQCQPTEFQRSIKEAAEARVRFIMQNRERLVEAWIAETSLLPSQSELVEKSYEDGTLTVHVRKLAPHA